MSGLVNITLNEPRDKVCMLPKYIEKARERRVVSGMRPSEKENGCRIRREQMMRYAIMNSL